MENLKSNIHNFIIWEKARKKTDIILQKIEEQFIIKEIFEVRWSKKEFGLNLKRFYGDTLPNTLEKIESCGKGKFLVIIIEDSKSNYGLRKTSIGKQVVNTNVYDAKMIFRKLIGGKYPIHASINKKETDHDLTLIFGKNLQDFKNILIKKWDGTIKEFNGDLQGTNGWKDIKQLFYVLNSTTNYIVLRNFENFTKNILEEKHQDIDLLTDDKWQINYLLNQKILKNSNGVLRPYVMINDNKISFDLRYVGDTYYDEKWSKHMLNRKILSENGFYRPNDEDYFYSLLYHCLIHKLKISSDYKIKLITLGKKIRLKNKLLESLNDSNNAKKILEVYLKKKKYRYTSSLFYKFSHNELTRITDVAIYTLKKEGIKYLLRAIKAKMENK
jgi:hypothetical protein